MRTVIYLSNQEVRVLTGTIGGRKIKIESEYYALAPAGSISDGKITDKPAFIDFLRRLIEANNIPCHDVILVLGSTAVLTRRLEVPRMSRKKVIKCLTREFAGVTRTKDPVYSYIVLDRNQYSQTILAHMAEREYLESCLEVAAASGTRVVSVVTVQAADIAVLNKLPQVQEGIVVIQTLEGTNIRNLLLIHGKCFYFNRIHTTSMPGTPDFGMECARAVHRLQQFLRREQVEEEISDIFLGGGYDKATYDVVYDSLVRMNDKLNVQMLSEDVGSTAFHQSGSGSSAFSRFYPLMGALLIPADSRNLLYQMKYHSKETVRWRNRMKYIWPLLLTLVICIGASVLQLWRLLRVMEQTEQQYQYLNNPDHIQRMVEYDRIKTQNADVIRQIELTDNAWDYLQSYPVMTTHVKRVVDESIAGLGTAVVTDYQAAAGTVTIEIGVVEVSFVNQFIMRLEAYPETFERLEYSGFTYDERTRNWNTSVICHLNRPDHEQLARQNDAEVRP